MTNRGFTSIMYLKCRVQEDWRHIILCNTLQSERREFIIRLYDKLMKANIYNDNKQFIINMLSDIVSYFNRENKNKIIQSLVSTELILRGMIVKD